MGNEKKNTSKAPAKAAKKQKPRLLKKKRKRAKKRLMHLQRMKIWRMNREWEDAHKVTEELVEGPPSRRANKRDSNTVPKRKLFVVYFYNDVYRCDPGEDEWRKFVSPTCPGPRSAHAVVASAAGGGKHFLFGGEFSSLHQNTFHHYRDFWCFDISTHSWDRLDTKIRPSVRSGHRMAMWKHYIVLFGGFYDPGHRTQYLNDTWVYDTQEYKWRQIEFKDIDRKPSHILITAQRKKRVLISLYARRYRFTWMFQFLLPIPLQLVHIMSLETSQSSTISSDSLGLKWERRKKPSFAPHIRSGCTMGLWSAKSIGILFGGVTDEDRDEESLESVFWNDLYGYQLVRNGRWQSMRKAAAVQQGESEFSDGDDAVKTQEAKNTEDPDVNPDDPILTAPIPRYNAMLAVLRNTLYIYGGIFERGSREYTLDDFYSIQLDKLEQHTCLKHSGIVIPAEGDEISSDDDDDEGVESDEGGDSDSETRLGEDDAVLNKKLDDNQDAEEVDKPVDVLHHELQPDEN
ncbi:hypothetical protein EDD22DRAFT_850622 [Suillus occidentalis]|nr:hypothetical protein EDD22DRAFT_850622 [Suillus occidentalis]